MAGEIKLGVIGLGHWGPNHVRAFEQRDGARVLVCADLSQERRTYLAKSFHGIEWTESAHDVLTRKDIDAVIIATPAHTHFDLAKKALENGKHVLVEKPICSSHQQAEELIALSLAKKQILMVGHIFLHNPGIRYIKEAFKKGELGAAQYLDATRTNLGPIREDANVVWDLMSHEFSIFDYFFGALPKWISVSGSRLIGTPREDVAFAVMEYPNGVLAHAHSSWFHPQKARTITFVGDKKMAVWNDLDFSEPVKLFNKGVAEEPYYDSFGQFQHVIREADMVVPKISAEEPLRIQAAAFIDKIRKNLIDKAELDAVGRVMRCLEAATESLKSEGRRVKL